MLVQMKGIFAPNLRDWCGSIKISLYDWIAGRNLRLGKRRDRFEWCPLVARNFGNAAILASKNRYISLYGMLYMTAMNGWVIQETFQHF